MEEQSIITAAGPAPEAPPAPSFSPQALGFADEAALRDHLSAQAERLNLLEAQAGDLQAQLVARQAAYEALALRAAFHQAAAAYRFYDPEEAHRLLDWSGLQVGPEGQVEGLEAALRALVAARPHLIRPAAVPQADGRAHSQHAWAPEGLSAEQVEQVKRRFRLG
jgi:hypothetical protein